MFKVTHGDHRFYAAAVVSFALGTGLILCHLLFLPDQHSLAMALIVVGIAVAISSGVIASIPLVRWGKRTERVKAGLCPTCGYDLTANLSGVCPECGKAVKQ